MRNIPLQYHDLPLIDNIPLIKVVGISASGKSTLVRALRQHGYEARPVSQEHSNVADLWQQFEHPWLLFYLDVDLTTQRERRPDVTWDQKWLDEEIDRLRHARDHADLVINTAGLQPEMVLQIALTFLQNEEIRHADHPLPPLAATGSVRQLHSSTPDANAEHEKIADGKQRSNRTERRLAKRRQKRRNRDDNEQG